jgi:hypothetical protein
MAEPKAKISIEADNSKLLSSLSASTRAVQGTADKMRSSFGNVGATIGAAFGAIAGSAVTAFVKRTVDAIDALNDLSDATGSSIENLSGLEEVARRNGGTLEDVAGVIVKFNKALNDVGDEKSGAARVLKELGLNAEELKRIDPALALQKVAVAMQGVARDGNLARATQLLFGKSIQEAAPFLKDLAEAGELNAKVTTDQAAAAEVFNKQLFAVETQIGNAARALVIGLIPTLSDLTKAFTDVAGGSGDFSGAIEVASEVTKGLAVFVANVTFAVKDLFAELSAAVDIGKALAKLDFAQAKSIHEQNIADSQRSKEALSALEGKIAQAGQLAKIDPKRIPGGFEIKAAPRTINVPEPSKGGQAKASKKDDPFSFISDEKMAAIRRLENTDVIKIAKLRGELQELLTLKAVGAAGADEAIANITDELEKMSPAFVQAEEDAKRLADMLDATDSAKLEQAREKMQFLAKAFEDGKINAEQFGEAANAALGITADAADPALERMQKFNEQFDRNIQQSLGDTFKKTFRGDTKDIAKLWGDMLLDMTADSLAADIGPALAKSIREGVTGALDALVTLFKEVLAQMQAAAQSGEWGGIIAGLFTGGTGGGINGGAVLPNSLRGGAADGATMLERDMILLAHKGESIVPKKYNPAAGGMGGGGMSLKVEIVNTGTPQKQTGSEMSNGKLRVFVEDIVASSIGGGGKVGKSMQSTFGLSRAAGAARLG